MNASGAEQPDNPFLVNLKEHQRKRETESATEEQRPSAKVRRLTAELFAVCAAPSTTLDIVEAGSSCGHEHPARKERASKRGNYGRVA